MKKKRAADRHGREKQLAPYTKRIELGIAAMGKTRAVASVRKRKLEKSAECPYCGKPFGPDAGVADHIHPSLGAAYRSSKTWSTSARLAIRKKATARLMSISTNIDWTWMPSIKD